MVHGRGHCSKSYYKSLRTMHLFEQQLSFRLDYLVVIPCTCYCSSFAGRTTLTTQAMSQFLTTSSSTLSSPRRNAERLPSGQHLAPDTDTVRSLSSGRHWQKSPMMFGEAESSIMNFN